MTKKGTSRPKYKLLEIATKSEAEIKQDASNVWHPLFGWVLKDGRPTINSKAYWAWMRRNPN